MPDYRKFTQANRRNLVDYVNFFANSGEYVLLCTNRAVLDVARLFLKTRGLWRTTYATSYDDNGYFLPDDSQMDTIDELISEFLEDTNIMNCDDFLSELSSIEAAIKGLAGGSGVCGCGSAGAGATEPEESSQEADPPGTPGGEYPPGFGSQGEYETYKCDVATWLVDSARDSVGWMLTVDLVLITALAFGAGLLTPVPGDEIIALIGLILMALVESSGALDAWYDAYVNNRAEMICAIYQSTSVSDAKSAGFAVLDAGIDAETSDLVVRVLLKQTARILTRNNSLNKLFEKDEFTDFPTGNCSGCVCVWEISQGTGTIDETGTQFEVTAAWGGASYQVGIHLTEYNPCCEHDWRLYFDGFTGSPTPNNGAGVWDCTGFTRLVSTPTMPIDDWDDVGFAQQTDYDDGGWGMLFRLEQL